MASTTQSNTTLRLVPGLIKPTRPVTPQASAATLDTSPVSASGDHFLRSSRQQRYDLIVDLVASRIYVVNKATGQPVDRYLTSPGTKKYPTLGDSFVIQRALVKAPWIPPASKWAENAKTVPGGLNNPMGIFKLDLGGYAEFIHGTPVQERKDLGRPASHGCMRMSNENVLQLYQLYAGVGTKVTILRDPDESRRLRAAFRAQGLKDHAITDGAELVAGAIAGKAPTPIDQ